MRHYLPANSNSKKNQRRTVTRHTTSASATTTHSPQVQSFNAAGRFISPAHEVMKVAPKTGTLERSVYLGGADGSALAM